MTRRASNDKSMCVAGFCHSLWRDFASFYGGILPHSMAGFWDFASFCGGILPHSMAGFCLILWRDFGILPHSVAGFYLILWRDFTSFCVGISPSKALREGLTL